jgi:hypothetical protein
MYEEIMQRHSIPCKYLNDLQNLLSFTKTKLGYYIKDVLEHKNEYIAS